MVDELLNSLDFEAVLLKVKLGEIEVALVEVPIEAILVVAEIGELAVDVLTVESQLKVVIWTQFLTLEVCLAVFDCGLCLDAAYPDCWQHCPIFLYLSCL